MYTSTSDPVPIDRISEGCESFAEPVSNIYFIEIKLHLHIPI